MSGAGASSGELGGHADPHPGDHLGDGVFARDLGGPWQQRAATLAAVGRLVTALLADARVPVQAKAGVAAALGYAVLPATPLGRWRRRRGLADAALLALAVRGLIVDAGYEVVRERWTGSDAGFAWLLAITGVAR